MRTTLYKSPKGLKEIMKETQLIKLNVVYWFKRKRKRI